MLRNLIPFTLILLFLCAANVDALGQSESNLFKNGKGYVSMDLIHAGKQGTKLNLDMPISRRSSLHIGRANVYTYNPVWLTNDVFFGSFLFEDSNPSDLQGVVSQELHAALKFGIGRKALALRGWYWGPEFRHGSFTSISWESNDNQFAQPLITQGSQFIQFGLAMGWQRVVLEDLYLDFNLHLLMNSTDEVVDPVFFFNSFELNPSIPVVGRFGLSIGGAIPSQKAYESKPVAKNKLMSLTLDLNSFIRSGIRLDLHLPLKKEWVLGLNAALYNSKNQEIDLLEHRDINNYKGFGLGTDIRLYLPGYEALNGPFWEASYGYQRLSADYFWTSERRQIIDRITETDDAHSMGLAFGYSKVFAGNLSAEVFLRNRLVIAKTEFRERAPYGELFPGLRSGIGLRIGIAL